MLQRHGCPGWTITHAQSGPGAWDRAEAVLGTASYRRWTAANTSPNAFSTPRLPEAARHVISTQANAGRFSEGAANDTITKMSDNLLPLLAPLDADYREVLYVLKTYFKFAAISDKDVIYLPPGDKHHLRVKVERDRIRYVQRGPGFDKAEFDELQRLVRKVIVDSPSEKVARAILFSSLPVPGTLSMPGIGLKISPAPDSAPQPGVIYADNPFLLEFRVPRGGGDWTITNQRRARLAGEWSLVLNAILRTRIWFPTPRGTHHWVYDDKAGVSRWLSASYNIPDFELYADSFTEAAGPALPLAPHEEYYGSDVRPGAERDQLVLPDSLPDLLGVFARMAPSRRSQFLRAATWIQIASRTWDVSASSWYTAHVSAIETFVEPDYNDKCEKCASVLGVTRAFKEVVERYSPDSDKTMRNRVYDYRSKLTHGSILLQLDEAPWSFGSTFRAEEDDASRRLVRITRDVMVNWLRKFASIERLAAQLTAVGRTKQSTRTSSMGDTEARTVSSGFPASSAAWARLVSHLRPGSAVKPWWLRRLVVWLSRWLWTHLTELRQPPSASPG